MHGLRVIVVGAGIGGLAAGISLQRFGFDVEVFERAPELRAIGAGICMWPNGAKAVNELGLGPAMEMRSPVLNAIRYVGRDGQVAHEVSCRELVAATGVRPYPLARSDLHLAQLEQLQVPLHLDKECVGVEQRRDHATVHFADGSEATGDVVVAADGARSVIREHVAGAVSLRYLYMTWVGLTAADPIVTPPDAFTFYTDRSMRVGVLPVSEGRMYYFFDAPVAEDWAMERDPVHSIQELFGDWPPPVQRLIDSLSPDSTIRTPIADLDPLPTFVRGRVALIGDAAHATAPTLGQGGALAMEDAIVLTRYLISTTVSVDDALRRYDSARRERAIPIVLTARARARAMVQGGPPDETETDDLIRNGGRPEAFAEILATIANSGPLG